MVKRLASFLRVMKKSGQLTHPNDEVLLSDIASLIAKAEAIT
jgi:hypothetical protein